MRAKGWLGCGAAMALMGAAGCHSAYVQAAVENRTEETIALVEVDYPSASFGTENLKPGGVFHYRFKVLGSGETTVLWTDAEHHDHKATGPKLNEGAEGSLTVALTGTGATWSEQLKGR